MLKSHFTPERKAPTLAGAAGAKPVEGTPPSSMTWRLLPAALVVASLLQPARGQLLAVMRLRAALDGGWSAAAQDAPLDAFPDWPR